MEWVETTGRSVEEAKDAALDQLGVDEHDAEFVVLSEPRPGLFGRMRGEARVRARVRPTRPRPKQGRSRRSDQERRGGRRSRSPGAQRGGGASEAPMAVSVAERQGGPTGAAEPTTTEDAASGATGTRSPSRSPRRRRTRSGAAGARSTGVAEATSGSGSEGAAVSGSTSARPSRQTASRHAKQQRGQARVSDEVRLSSAVDEEEEGVGEELSLEDQGETAREFVEGLVAVMGLHASVDMSVLDGETVQVSVEGPELGILVGPGGGTLFAVQELARTVVQRRTGGRSERILIDVAGYRAKRAAALQRFTRKVAEEVIDSGSERALEPMSPSDRKVVHDTVNEIEGVSTRSVGEEPKRYIIIAPTNPVPVPDEVGDA